MASRYKPLDRSVILPVASDTRYQKGDGWGADRSYRGGTHMGRDYRAAEGTPVLAVADGVVTRVMDDYRGRKKPGQAITGNVVYIYSKEQNATFRYMHLQGETGLKAGQKVRAGQIVGAVGVTGTVTSASHLHIDVIKGRYDGSGPRNYIPFERFEAKAGKITLADAKKVSRGGGLQLAAVHHDHDDPIPRPKPSHIKPARVAYRDDSGDHIRRGGRDPWDNMRLADPKYRPRRSLFGDIFRRHDDDEKPAARVRHASFGDPEARVPARSPRTKTSHVKTRGLDIDGDGRISKRDRELTAIFDANGNGVVTKRERDAAYKKLDWAKPHRSRGHEPRSA
jgi:murein DD-endopeptidase MepM/ murein hydrolase activator NlpD